MGSSRRKTRTERSQSSPSSVPTLLPSNFVYCVNNRRAIVGDRLSKCLVCEEKTFLYQGEGICWSYCYLCRVFYTPHQEKDISRFLAEVAAAL